MSTKFFKRVIAKMTGDKATDLALRNEKIALHGIKQQISALEGKQLEFEDKLREAEEELENAKFPTEAIVNGKDYIIAIKTAQDKYEEVVEELKSITDSITFFEKLKEEYSEKA